MYNYTKKLRAHKTTEKHYGQEDECAQKKIVESVRGRESDPKQQVYHHYEAK